jgi:hydrogenase maturation factor
MRVLRVDRASRLAICVKPRGETWPREEVAIDLVEPVLRGQTLLVHAGVALANLDQTDAALAVPSTRGEPLEPVAGPAAPARGRRR